MRLTGRAMRLPSVAPAAIARASTRALSRMRIPESIAAPALSAPMINTMSPLKIDSPGTNEMIPAVIMVVAGVRSQRASNAALAPTAAAAIKLPTIGVNAGAVRL